VLRFCGELLYLEMVLRTGSWVSRGEDVLKLPVTSLLIGARFESLNANLTVGIRAPLKVCRPIEVILLIEHLELRLVNMD
jgi:hypothetical protein